MVEYFPIFWHQFHNFLSLTNAQLKGQVSTLKALSKCALVWLVNIM